MRDVLRELGLPDHGDKTLKIWRHKEYINLYEANADSLNPVGFQTLRKRLDESEQCYISSKQTQAKRKETDMTDYNILFNIYVYNLYNIQTCILFILNLFFFTSEI